MATTTKSMDRLEDWLKTENLPAMAKTCIRNFVCSCDRSTIDDLDNFVVIDIINFTPEVQHKLVRGYIFAYYGLKPAIYQPEKMPDIYQVHLN